MRIKKVFSAVSCILAAMLVANSVVISGYAKNDVKSSNRKVNLTAEQKDFINNIKSNESSVVEVPKNDIVTFIVEINSKTLSELAEENGYENILEFAVTDKCADLAAEIEQNREQVKSSIMGQVPQADFSDSKSYKTVFSGFSFDAPYSCLEELQNIPGVVSVSVAGEQKLSAVKNNIEDDYTQASNYYTKAEINPYKAYELGYTGKNTTIAIIDSGFRTTHDAFSVDPPQQKYNKNTISVISENIGLNSSQYASADDMYVSGKIPYAFDYAENDTDVFEITNSHGTHVAGIAAGNNGKTGEKEFKGSAYDAQLMFMKVGMSNETLSDDAIVAAVDDAVALGADVINLSLGLDRGFSVNMDNVFAQTVQNAAKAGSFFSASAGNSGVYQNDIGMSMDSNTIDYGTVGSPSTIAETVSVASAENGNFATEFEFNNNEKSIVFTDCTGLLSEKHFDSLEDSIAYTYFASADEFMNTADFGNELVFLDYRSSMSCSEIINKANNCNAFGIVFITDEPAANVITFENNMQSSVALAVISVSDGEYLRNHSTGSLSINNMGDYVKSDTEIADYSSAGCTPELTLKPDITTVGSNVISAYSGGDNQYIAYSGTSMAAPYYSGLCADVIQYINESGIDKELQNGEMTRNEVIAALTMSTANLLKNTSAEESGVYYSPRYQGAGIADLYGAVTAKAVLTAGENGKLRPKAELGDNTEGLYSFDFYVNNISNSAITYQLSSILQSDNIISDSYTDEDGNVYDEKYNLLSGKSLLDNATVKFSRDSVTVQPKSSEKITVSIALDKSFVQEYMKLAENGFFVDGFIKLTPNDENDDTLSIPFMGFCGSWIDAPLFRNTVYNGDGNWLSDDRISIIRPKSYDEEQGIIEYNELGVAGVNRTTWEVRNDRIYVNGSDFAFPWCNVQRSSKNYTLTYKDSNGNVVFTDKWDEYSPTNLTYETYKNQFIASMFDNYPKLQEGDYTITVTGEVTGFLDKQRKTNTQTFNFSVDNSAPDTPSVERYSENGEEYIKITSKDNIEVQDIDIDAAVFNEETGEYTHQYSLNLGEVSADIKAELYAFLEPVNVQQGADGLYSAVYSVADIQEAVEQFRELGIYEGIDISDDKFYISSLDYAYNYSDAVELSLSSEQPTEPKTQPGTQPTEPKTEPATQPTVQPKTEPVTQPIIQPKTEPTTQAPTEKSRSTNPTNDNNKINGVNNSDNNAGADGKGKLSETPVATGTEGVVTVLAANVIVAAAVVLCLRKKRNNSK